MSAFLVSRGHIRLMVEAGLRFADLAHGDALRWYSADLAVSHRLDYTNASAVGTMLWIENGRSIGFRYPDTVGRPNKRPGTFVPGTHDIDGPERGYEHRPAMNLTLTIEDAWNALRCYEYQSCEHDEWEASEAHAFCRALARVLMEAAIKALRAAGAPKATCEWSAPDAWEPERGARHSRNGGTLAFADGCSEPD